VQLRRQFRLGTRLRGGRALGAAILPRGQQEGKAEQEQAQANDG
jgi:hypothetical protein